MPLCEHPDGEAACPNHGPRPVSLYYPPSYYGYSLDCTVCGLTILPEEDWEGDGQDGAKHRTAPKGCVKALGREIIKLREQIEKTNRS